MTTEKGHPSLIAFLDVLLNKLTQVINSCLGILILAMGLVLGANIVLRYLFNDPIAWSNVVSRYAYIYIVLLGTAISYIEGSHAQIDIVYNGLSGRSRKFCDLLHYLAMLFLCIILIVFGSEHVITMWPAHSPALKFLSMGVVYLSIPMGAVVMVIFLIRKLLGLSFN